MRTNKKCTVFIIGGLILVLILGQMWTAGKGFSAMENRYLAAMPQANWQNIRSGAYMEDLETYMADHIPFRDQWIQLKNSIERLSGREQIDDIYFAGDHRLIEVKNISFEQLEANMQTLAAWTKKLPETIHTEFLLAPTASWIYQDELPAYALTYSPQQALEIIREALPESVYFVCAYDELVGHKEEAIYFKSDHHWTMRGAAYAYQALMESRGESVADIMTRESRCMSEEFKGSLYSQAPVFGYPQEQFWVMDSPGLHAIWTAEGKSATVLMPEMFEKKDQYTAFMGGNYGLTRVHNEAAERQETLLLLKDSYANSMVPFLAEVYQEIIMIDLRYYRENLSELIEQEQIKQILCLYNMDFLCTDQSFVWLKRS